MKKCINCGRVSEIGKDSAIITGYVNRSYAGNNMAGQAVTESVYSDLVRFHVFTCERCENIRMAQIAVLIVVLIPAILGSIALIAIANNGIACLVSAVIVIPLLVLLVLAYNRNKVNRRLLKIRYDRSKRNSFGANESYEVVDPHSRVMAGYPAGGIQDEYLDQADAASLQFPGGGAGGTVPPAGSKKWVWIVIILGVAAAMLCLCLIALAIVFRAYLIGFINASSSGYIY